MIDGNKGAIAIGAAILFGVVFWILSEIDEPEPAPVRSRRPREPEPEIIPPQPKTPPAAPPSPEIEGTAT